MKALSIVSFLLPCESTWCLQPSTCARLSVRLQLSLNSRGDFVTQSCCRGNMSHLRSTWVGSSLALNARFRLEEERPAFHWTPSWQIFEFF